GHSCRELQPTSAGPAPFLGENECFEPKADCQNTVRGRPTVTASAGSGFARAASRAIFPASLGRTLSCGNTRPPSRARPSSHGQLVPRVLCPVRLTLWS